ncbi:CAP domain-containing protein [Actinokineospora iranica]|nr:CAP domain-containing protein [Actinokineospora iranica]
MISIAASALVGIVLGAGTAQAQPSPEQQVIHLTNKHRAAVGCGALTANPALMSAAKRHADQMARHDHFSHNGVRGEDPGHRISAAGYPAQKWAENIAYAQTTPRAVVAAWMNSPAHRVNMLDCALTDIGVGRSLNSKKQVYWAQDFGTPIG